MTRQHCEQRRTARLLRGALAGIVLLGCVLGLAAPAAWAHETLMSSSPAAGEQLSAVPSGVTLTFSGDLQPSATARVTVMGPDGAPMHTRATLVTVDTLTQPLVDGGGAAGLYTVDYTATSADGHPVTGQLGFYVAGAETAQTGVEDAATPPGRAPAAEDGTGTGAVVWALSLVGAFLLVALATRLLRRRPPRAAPPTRPVPPSARRRQKSTAGRTRT